LLLLQREPLPVPPEREPRVRVLPVRQARVRALRAQALPELLQGLPIPGQMRRRRRLLLLPLRK